MLRVHIPVRLKVLLLIAVYFLFIPVFALADWPANDDLRVLHPEAIATGDLDGDDILDTASGVETVHTDQGYAYRVDLNLSEHPEADSFTVYSDEPTGLNVQAIDVDGDRDLDLIVTSRLTRQPIGVWINDGRGNFSRNDSSTYALRVWQTAVKSLLWDTFRVPIMYGRWSPGVHLTNDRVDSILLEPSGVWFASPSPVFSTSIDSARYRAPPDFPLP
jgi:hypothetical protein